VARGDKPPVDVKEQISAGVVEYVASLGDADLLTLIQTYVATVRMFLTGFCF
jgi:hypothetical protein